MNILYASASRIPAQGADTVHVMKMCQALAALGHDVTLTGIEGDKALGDAYAYHNVEPSFRIALAKAGDKHVVQRLCLVLTCARKAEMVYTRYALAALLCAVLLRKPVVYEYHCVMDRRYNIVIEALLATMRHVRHVFITEALRQAYLKRNKRLAARTCTVLPDGADAPEEQPAAEQPLAKSDVAPRQLSCGYIGSFRQGKGVELVIEMANACTDITFHIVGGRAEELDGFKALAKHSNIVWHGYLGQKDAMRVLRNEIDIALLPNQRHVIVGRKTLIDIGAFTSPMKLFEYMAYGKAIVASRLAVLEEVVNDGNNALLADPEDVAQWIAAIRRLQTDAALYNRLCTTAQSDFITHYTWRARAEKAVALMAPAKANEHR